MVIPPPIIMLLILSIFLPVKVSTQCVLTKDPENVVATQLAGDWDINLDLTSQLWPEYLGIITITGISFTDDPSIVDMLPEEDCRYLMDTDRVLFLAGEITFKNTTFNGEDDDKKPYVLTSWRGNPRFWYWHSTYQFIGSLNLMIAKASERANDLLFIGGDHNSQPFSAWK